MHTIDWTKLRPTSSSTLPPPRQVLTEAAVTSQALTSFLSSAMDARDPILLCVNDPHRSTQTRPALDLIHQLTKKMARPPGFRVLVATGTHQFSTSERTSFEQAVFAGCDLSIEYVEWHDAKASSLVMVAGIRANKLLADHRFILPIGSVEPHYFAGASGPHKTIAVGCMSREDIERNHAGALSPESDVFRLRGNPVYEGHARTVRDLMADGKKFCSIAEVVHGDRIAAAAVGDPLDVTDELLPASRGIYAHEISQCVDLLHLRVPAPLGRSFYQADKALKNNHLAVRDGGAILLEAELQDGIGPADFLKLLQDTRDYAHARETVERNGYRLGDHKAVKLHYLTDTACRDVRVVLVSEGVTQFDLADTPIHVSPDVEGGLAFLDSSPGRPLVQGMIIDDAGTACTTLRR